MPIEKNQLRDLISRTLMKIPKLYSKNAVELLMLTAATESDLGTYLVQVGGPALGLMQVEPNTMRDNYGNYLYFRDRLRFDIGEACGVYEASEWQLESNMAFNILMARLKYWRSDEPMPDTLLGMAVWHEKWYNTKNNYNGTDIEHTLSKYHYFCS